MNKKYLMAIDGGTGSIRAVVFDTEGNQLSSHQREWFHHEDPAYPGSMNFDWETNWALAKECIDESIKKAEINSEDILGISTTSMREGIVLYDENLKELWACANVDSRSSKEASDMIVHHPSIEKDIYMLSGQTSALDAIPRLLWVKENLPDIYEKTRYINMFNDWLIYKLTGIMTSEPSNACTTGIFNIATRAWAPEILSTCGLKEDILPPIAESGTAIGKVSSQCSLETLLSTETVVVSGGGDAQLGGVGTAVVKDGQIGIFGGSFWQLEYNTSKVQVQEDMKLRVNCHAVPGMWQYEAIAFNPGLVLRWFRDAFLDLDKVKAEEQGKDVYDLMNAEAEKIPVGSYGLYGVFSNIMDYKAWRHAAPTFTNFGLDPFKWNKYTFYRSILENAAFVTRGHLDLVKEATGDNPSEVIFSNGASKSPLWCQILADVLGVRVKVPMVKEATALGAAICAAVGAGLYKDIQSAAQAFVQWDKEYTPNDENHKTYTALFETWKKINNHQLQQADEGLTTHMWKAPGI